MLAMYIRHIWVCPILITLSGDIEKNPVTKPSSCDKFSRNTRNTRNSSSCIELIFASEPNLVMKSGVDSSLHKNCNHQIIYAKFNLQIYYPPP